MKRIGSTRIRLAKLLTEIIGEEVRPENLIPAQGWYRCQRSLADVMAWTGWTGGEPGRGITRSIGSWDPMSEALQHGFVVYDNRREHRSYSDFEISTLTPKNGETIDGVTGMGRWIPPRLRAAS